MTEVRQFKILLLEDSFEDAELLQRRISRSGSALKVKHVTTKAEYVESLNSFCPDIIVSDYKLPDIDGPSAIKLARAKNPNIPFITVSGFIDDSHAMETLDLGATDYVLKDRPERLGPAIQRALREAEHRRLEEELAKRSNQLEAENEELRKRESRIRQLKSELMSLRNQLKTLD